MASFAKLGLNGKVLSVVCVNNNIITDENNIEVEQKGINFLTEMYNWPIWAQCSYNTSEGVHLLGGTPFRKNFPGIDYKYDEDRDAFIPPKPHSNWILDKIHVYGNHQLKNLMMDYLTLGITILSLGSRLTTRYR